MRLRIDPKVGGAQWAQREALLAVDGSNGGGGGGGVEEAQDGFGAALELNPHLLAASRLQRGATPTLERRADPAWIAAGWQAAQIDLVARDRVRGGGASLQRAVALRRQRAVPLAVARSWWQHAAAPLAAAC
jgi:hypothetical protein